HPRVRGDLQVRAQERRDPPGHHHRARVRHSPRRRRHHRDDLRLARRRPARRRRHLQPRLPARAGDRGRAGHALRRHQPRHRSRLHVPRPAHRLRADRAVSVAAATLPVVARARRRGSFRAAFGLRVILVRGAARWVQFSRIVRAGVLSIREREFVAGARARGNRPLRLLLRHVLPNALTPIIVVATLELAFMIIYESALSFLGLGVQPPTPTWGWMLSDGRNYLATAWWLATLPGLAIMLTVLAVNLLGDWLRDTLDPRLKV